MAIGDHQSPNLGEQQWREPKSTNHESSNAQQHQVQQVFGLTADQCSRLLALLGSTANQNHGNEHLANFAGKCTLLGDPWIIDSGASEHMVGSEKGLNNVKCVFSYPPIKIPDGSTLKVTHIGTAYIAPKIQLKNTICIPGFKCNLLSVAKATKDLNCSITFFPIFCTFQDLDTGMLIGTGKLQDGVY